MSEGKLKLWAVRSAIEIVFIIIVVVCGWFFEGKLPHSSFFYVFAGVVAACTVTLPLYEWIDGKIQVWQIEELRKGVRRVR